MIKRFVLDTNILLEFPRAMAEDFADNTVIICGTVLQELNAKKTADGEIGYNAREAGRILDAFRKTGDLLYGVPTPSGGQLVFAPNGVKQENLPEGFSISSPDNRILSACVSLNKRDPKNPVILVTSDVLMRLSATACGIETQEFRKVMVEESSYDGHTTIDVAQEKIDELYKEKHISAEFLPDPLYENEFITLTAGSSSALSVYQKGGVEPAPAAEYRLDPSKERFAVLCDVGAHPACRRAAARDPGRPCRRSQNVSFDCGGFKWHIQCPKAYGSRLL